MNAVLREADTDGDGLICFNEFKTYMIKTKHPCAESEKLMLQKFKSIDLDKNGTLSLDELVENSIYYWKVDQIAKKKKNLHEIDDVHEAKQYIAENITKIMREMDENKDGKISMDEFVKYHFKIKSPASGSMQMLKAKFNAIDRDRSGFLDFEELFEHSLYEWKVDHRERQRKMLCNIDDPAVARKQIAENLRKVMKQMDTDGDGEISYAEFKAYNIAMKTPQSKDEKMLKAKFNSIDRDRSGKLSFEELLEHGMYDWQADLLQRQRKNVLKNLHQTSDANKADLIIDNSLKNMMAKFDANGDGEIDWNEFLTYHKTMNTQQSKDENILRAKFNAIDTDRSGKLSVKELKQYILEEWKVSQMKKSNKVFFTSLKKIVDPKKATAFIHINVDKFMREFDTNKDGELDFAEYKFMHEQIQSEFSKNEAALRNRFNAIDEDGSGKLSAGEMKKFMMFDWQISQQKKQRLNDIKHLHEIKDPRAAKTAIKQGIDRVMRMADTDNDGMISFEEFVAYHQHMKTPFAKSEQLLKAKFKAIDSDKSGWLSQDELMAHLLYEWKVEQIAISRGKSTRFTKIEDIETKKEAEAAIHAEIRLNFEKMDSDKDGIISWEEFKAYH